MGSPKGAVLMSSTVVPGVRPMSMSRRFTAPRWLPTCSMMQLPPTGSWSSVTMFDCSDISDPSFLLWTGEHAPASIPLIGVSIH